MSTPNLNTIRKNAQLHKVFVGYLNGKNYISLYKFMLKNNDIMEAVDFFATKINGHEEKFLGKLKNVMLGAWGKIKKNVESQMRNDGKDPTGADKNQVADLIFEDPQLERIYFQLMGRVEDLFEDLSQSDDFLKSKSYQTYVKQTIKKNSKSLQKDLKLEADRDDFLGLAFALQTGDSGSARSLSNLIAEADEKKTKKKTRGGDVLSRMQKALKKIGLG